MTPIRVRGKKQESWKLPRKGKQVSKLEERSKPIMSAPARELSQLERLPNELLQEIFLQSLNLNLPRASPTLGANLASSHIKMLLVSKAFSSDCGKCLEHSAELLWILQTRQEIAELQSAILRLKWMTLDFLRQHIRTLLVKTMLRRVLELGLDWSNSSKSTEATITESLENAHKNDSLSVSGALFGDHMFSWSVCSNTKVVLEVGLSVGNIFLQTITYKQDCKPVKILQYRWKLLLCLDECRIPDKLLHGPWTDAKCDFLEVVIRSGASVDWVNSTSGEVADLGLKEAILEGNQRAVEMLVHPRMIPRYRRGHFSHDASYHMLPTRQGVPDAKPRKVEEQIRRRKSLKLHVGVPIRTEHLRIAIIQEGFPKDIVERLLNAKDFSIDLEDDINKRALQKKPSGNRYGEWLYDRLDQLRENGKIKDMKVISYSDSTLSTSSDDELDSSEMDHSESSFEHWSSNTESEGDDQDN